MVSERFSPNATDSNADRLPPEIQAVHEQLPSIEEEDETKRPAAILAACEGKIGTSLPGLLTRQMPALASSRKIELPVDRFLGNLLEVVLPTSLYVVYVLFCIHFFPYHLPPHTNVLRPKPLLSFASSYLEGGQNMVMLVSRPDYGVRPKLGGVEFVSQLFIVR